MAAWDGWRTVKLIAVGAAPAVPAGELEVDDTLLYNYGYRARVIGIEPSGAKSVRITTEDSEGRTWTQRKGRETLVAVGVENTRGGPAPVAKLRTGWWSK